MAADVLGRIWSLAEEVAAAQGVEVVEVEQGGGRRRSVIRLFIDRPGGVSLGDCERFSRALGERLDEADAVPSAYVLEVSSPGLNRPLRKPADFRRFAGRRLRLTLRGTRAAPEGGAGARPGKRVRGVLRGFRDGRVLMETGEGAPASFALEEIAKASLEVDWEAEFRGEAAAGPAPGGADEKNPDGGVMR